MKFIEDDNSFSLSDFKSINKYEYKKYSRAEDPETGKNQAYKLSIFGIIPSVTYNIRF